MTHGFSADPGNCEFLAMQNRLLETVRMMQMTFLERGISPGWCDSILEDLLKLTGSEFGFICELLHAADGRPFVRTHGIGHTMPDETTRRLFEEHCRQGPDLDDASGLWSQAITTGRLFISNDPAGDGFSTEPGQPPVHSFIGIPIKTSDGAVLGIMGLANRAGGYSEAVAEFLTPFTITYGQLIEHARESLSRKTLESELTESNRKFQRLVENISGEYCMYIHNAKGDMTYVSPSIEHILGWTPDELMVNYTTLLTDHPLNEKGVAYTEAALAGVRQPSYLMQMRHKDGSHRWVELSEGPLFDDAGQVLGIEGIVHDVTERREHEKQTWHQANFDQLTDLPNRSLFFDRLSRELSNSRRSHLFTAILMLDLDGFKAVNDRYGHEAGDRVLIEVSRRWQRHVRDTDTLARMGGDEFALIIGGMAASEIAAAVAEKMIEALSTPMMVSATHTCRVGVSVGIAIYPENALEMDSLLSAADAAMYESKQKGKGRFAFSNANPSSNIGEQAWLKLEAAHLTGVKEIDRQHADLVNLINQLNELTSQQGDREAIGAKLDELIDCTAQHFAAEERLIREHGYPESIQHEREHRSLMFRLEKLSQQMLERGELLILQSIKDWLLNHLAYSDKPLGEFIRSQTK